MLRKGTSNTQQQTPLSFKSRRGMIQVHLFTSIGQPRKRLTARLYTLEDAMILLPRLSSSIPRIALGYVWKRCRKVQVHHPERLLPFSHQLFCCYSLLLKIHPYRAGQEKSRCISILSPKRELPCFSSLTQSENKKLCFKICARIRGVETTTIKCKNCCIVNA